MPAIIGGLGIIAFAMLEFVALALGIAGVCQSDRRKTFSVLGIVFVLTMILGTIFIIVVGNMIEDEPAKPQEAGSGRIDVMREVDTDSR